MAGNTVEQYRAAIGLFYGTVRTAKFSFFSFYLFNILHEFLQYFANSGTLLIRYCRQYILQVNYFMQVIFLLLLMSGNVETNPGPHAQTMYTIDIFHLNIRSIRNKIDALISLVSDFDILCFTETHLDDNILNYDLSFDGFDTIFRKDRNCFGGGVLVYASNSLSVIRRADLEQQNIECIWIEIRDPTCNILLCCTYRPPNSDNSFWKYLSWSIDKASDKSNKIIIIGDLNVDFLNIPRSHPVNDILTGQLLENTIYEPTRVTQNTSTLIDPILVTNEVTVFDSGTLVVDPNISDHKCTYISIKTSVSYNKAYERKVWQYKNADFDKLNLLIKNTDWNTVILSAENVDQAVLNFSNTFLTHIRECIPEKVIIIRPKDKPW
uniref:Uncharacterized protein LOC111118283 n=1 Tax=Crassostrea virginica TaxID=6565 RepID=A0A8B8CFP9_CRAVI|nr:uncharacterized protein LOC111118283 [Crassostrea virginica]